MKHIDIAIEKMETNKHIPKDEEHISIIERIVQKTGNPKIAAVLALDLFLVGVDTVSGLKIYFTFKNNSNIHPNNKYNINIGIIATNISQKFVNILLFAWCRS